MKTSELNPSELDYWVAKAEGYNSAGNLWSPSTDWEYGGPLIHKYGLFLGVNVERTIWRAWTTDHSFSGYGETYLIAACRCIVSSVYGEEVSK